MCGIVGWIDWQQDLTTQGPLLDRMAETQRQRGPDAHGRWIAPHAALAHRRLSVIDPACGAQPMVYQAGAHSYVITSNSEIYNFRELRGELEERGHSFRTQSDTEVILHAYAEWGEACVERLNGIFAFGLWDEQQQTLLLARDPLGVKPLFYAQRGGAVLFGSELKALLAHPLVQAEVDGDGLAELFLSGMHTPGFGVYRDVHEVRPGHMIRFERERTRITRYWTLRSAPHTDDLATTVERIRELLDDTVQRQLMADVPLVTMLSGGLDSSGITALAAQAFRRGGRQLHTYSIDFAGSAEYFVESFIRPSRDEPWARRVAEHIGTHHHTIVVDTADLLENMLVPMRAHDLPAQGQIETSLYLLFKAMKQDATVTLSGESADELFGGYPWFHSEAALNTAMFPWAALVDQSAGPQFSWMSAEAQEHIQPRAYQARRYEEAIAELPRLEGEDAVAAKRREMFYLNLTRLLPVLLERKDRMSMASGFEARVPFCDHRLMQYVWNVPWEMKNVDQIEKGILRRAFADVLPDDARARRKSMFPGTQNPGYGRAVRALTLQVLDKPNAAIRPFINIPAVRAIAETEAPGLQGDLIVTLLERIIQIDAWLDEYHVRVC